MADVIGFDPVAYSIDGGLHPGLLLRTAQYAATGGAEGVVSAQDCRVHQLATPGRGIAIDPGAINIRNESGTSRNQTYVANASELTTLDGPTSTTVKRSYVVLVRIEDPEFGWPQPNETDALDHQYTKPIFHGPVPESTTHASQLNLDYSAYALARIDIPANTTTITDAMITDLREVANPLRRPKLTAVSLTSATADHAVNQDSWQNWPSAAAPFKVPNWATEMIIRVRVSGIWTDTGAVGASLRAVYSPFNGAIVAATATTPVIETTASAQRRQYQIDDQIPLPASVRGTTQYIYTQGAKFPGTAGGSGRLIAGNGTRVVYDIEFLQTAD